MKICIFETQHFEGAYPVIKLFDLPSNQITVITSYEAYERFEELLQSDLKKYEWIILPKRKSSFFRQLHRSLKKSRPDLLYLNTVSDNHMLYAFVLSLLNIKQVILTVHDINCLFQSRFAWNFKKAVIHEGKKWLIKKIDEFNVVSDTLIPYLKTKTEKILNIPGAIFEKKISPQTITNEIKLVVPGSLDKKRRNYEQVFELAALAEKEKLSMKIVLLGGSADEFGREIVEKTKKFSNQFCKIHSYSVPVVNQFEFDKQLGDCHFVFIPSVIDTKICGEIPETYGITKSSGNIFDVIKHAKPFFAPTALTISADLQTSCFKYDSLINIIHFLKNLKETPSNYDRWQNNALKNSEKFSIENLRQKNISLFG